MDWPLLGFFKEYRSSVARGWFFEVNLKLFTLGVLLCVLCRMLPHLRSSVWVVCALPFVLLTLTLGTQIWFEHSGYMKAAGSVFALGILLLPFDRSLLLRLLLLVNVPIGLYVCYDYDLGEYSHVYARQEGKQGAPDGHMPGKIPDPACQVVCLNPEPVWKSSKHGIWKRVHRGVKEIEVLITNQSSVPWIPSQGLHAIEAAYLWIDAQTLQLVGERQYIRTPLAEPIGPGETKQLLMSVHLPAKGEYILRLTMLQEGVGYFCGPTRQFASDYPVTIR